MRLPDLRVPLQVNGTPQYSAPRVVPQQDASGEQIANLGQELAVGGYAMSRAADFLQDEVDDAKSQTEFNLFAEETRKIERAYEAQEGEAAVNGLGPTMKALEENRKRFEARLDNEEQHKRFASRADVHEFHVRDRVERHNTAQTRNYNIGAQTAGAKDSNTQYLDLWRRGMPQDPQGQANWINATKLARETGLRQINKVSDLHGDSPEVRKQAVLAHTTDMHENVVRLLAKDRPDQAAAYMSRYASEIDPRRMDELQGLVRQADITERSGAISRAIIGEVSKRGGTITDQEVAAREIAEFTRAGKQLPQGVYDQTLQRIEYHFADQRRIAHEQRIETLRQAETVFSKDKAVTTDTLPEPMQREMERLGIYGDVRERETQVRARELAADKRDAKEYSPERDFRTMGILKDSIGYLENMEADPDATDAKKAEFKKWREEKLASLIAHHQALSDRVLSKAGAELPLSPAPKPETKKSMDELVREAIEDAWRARSR